MSRFLEIKCLSEDGQNKVLEDIAARIAARIKDGILTEKDVREVEEMRLRPLPDIQDVQNVYENHLFREKG